MAARLITALCNAGRRPTALLLVALALLLPLALPMPPPPAAAQTLAAETGTPAQPATTGTPLFDHGLMLIGCTGGLALGALSTVLPPVGGWAAAGVWMGGLGTMLIRGSLGCAYGGLAGAVASAARATVRWIEAEWRSLTTPSTPPLPVEGSSGT